MSLLVQNKPCLKNGSWEPLLGNLCLETLLGKSFPWEPVLGNFAWKPVLRKPVLANTWELFLVTLLAGNLAWEPVLGNLVSELVRGNLAWEFVPGSLENFGHTDWISAAPICSETFTMAENPELEKN